MKDLVARNNLLEGFSLENILEAFLAGTNDGFLILDDEFRIIHFNTLYNKFHQLHTGKVLIRGSYLPELSPEDSMKDILKNVKKALRNEVVKYTIKYPPINGNTFWYDMEFHPLRNKAGKIIGAGVGVFETTEINSAHERLRQSEELFKTLVQNSTDAFQLADIDFELQYISETVENVLGYKPSDLIRKNGLDNVHPDERDRVREWFKSLRTQPDKLVTIEYRVKNKEGKWIWIENFGRNMLSNPRVSAIVMNFRNIQSKKMADYTLVQAEQRLSLLLNNTEESFIILNSRLRIVAYNRAAQEHSPYFFTQELQSGLSILDLVNPEEMDRMIQLFEKVFDGEQMDRETTFVDDKKKQHIYSHIYRPLFDKDNDIFGVFITSTDITIRKKLTEDLAANSERLKNAQKIAKLGYFEYLYNNKSIFCSDEVYEILGIDKATNANLQFSEFKHIVHNEDRERIKAEIKHAIKGEKDLNVECRLKMEDGTDKVVLAMGGVILDKAGAKEKFSVTVQDITDSKMALLALQTMEGRFKSLFENSIDGVLITLPSGEIISGNPAVCKMLGYEEDEITEFKRSDLLDVESASVKQMIEERSRSGIFLGEILMKHKNGHIIPTEITSINMKDAQGNTYHSNIIRDITEKKKIEEEQQSLTQELIKNNQDLQQFSFITSHNLRAPVANLISLLNLYDKKKPEDEFNQLLIEKFEEATLQLNSTLNDLINVLVIKSNTNVDKQDMSLDNVLSEVRKGIDNLLLENKGVITSDFSEVDIVTYNRIHLESIFLNLLTNAIRYRSTERKPVIQITSFREGKWIVVSFKDNGLGIDLKRYGDRLFGLYQRFHESKEGKGLGLYMVNSQVVAMGGKIEVESEPGKGSTFKVYFKS
ncbi:MAG TPA: PAS domain S-box protein [Segetibacter sp.]|jgi:PAS domain S-box-containing protein